MNSPVVFYSGNTVARPGNTIGIRGEYLDQQWNATLADGRINQRVTLLQQTRHSFKFQIPENFTDGLFTLTLEGEKPLTIILNEPKVKWIQGDEGPTSTPNGWMRVQGECLRVRDNAPITLTLTKDGTSHTFFPERVCDDYSVGFRFVSLPEGDYQAVYSNGLAECPCGTVTVAPCPESLWPKQVYNVLDYGMPDDGISNCSPALASILNKVGEAGGGIVYFPRGRYLLTESFHIPNNTVLRGDGVDNSQICWRDAWVEREPGYEWWQNRFVLKKLPVSMITADSDVAIEHIEFAGGRIGGLFRIGSKEVPARNVRFQNVRVYFNAMSGVGSTSRTYPRRLEIIDEVNHHWEGQHMMDVRGSNIKWLDCDFNYSALMFKYGNDNQYVQMRGVRFGDGSSICKWLPVGDMDKAIIEDCEMVGKSFGCGGDNLYISRLNIHDNNAEGDREGFTTDIKGGIDYEGPVTVNSETSFTFPEEIDMQKAKVGAKLVITNGTGMGQWRRVIAVEGHTVTIEEPFAVAPDAESRLSVNYMFWNWYFTNSRVDYTGPFQLYVAQGNTVFDGIHITRSYGYVLRGTYGYKAMQQMWYNSVVNCTLANGNVYHMTGFLEVHGHFDKPGYLPCHSLLLIEGNARAKTNVGVVVRNCTVRNDCMIHLRNKVKGSIEDVILDTNHAIDSRCGIYQEGEVPLLLETGTTYVNVKDPYHFREDLGSWW